LSVNSNCRVAPKPVKWEYLSDPARKSLFDVTAELIKLRKTHSVFTNGDAPVGSCSGFVKQVSIKNKPFNPAPTTTSTMNVVAVANFDVTVQTPSVSFPHAGTWYEYYAAGAPITIANVSTGILFTDVKLDNTNPITGLEDGVSDLVTVFPNPAHTRIKVDAGPLIITQSQLITLQGSSTNSIQLDAETWDISSLASGLYVLELKTENQIIRKKIVKQ
jgi:hypothetical protein